jgi:hypothetical protein
MKEKKETPLMLSPTKVTREQRDWLDKNALHSGESISSVLRDCINEKMKGRELK